MLDLAKTLMTGIVSFFSIKFPGLNISFFSVFVAIAILHVVINTILTVYGLRSEPDDIVSAIAYDYTQDKIPGLAPRQKRFDPETIKTYAGGKLRAAEFQYTRNKAEWKADRKHASALRMGKRSYKMQQYKNMKALGSVVGRNVAIKANRKGLGKDIDKIFS